MLYRSLHGVDVEHPPGPEVVRVSYRGIDGRAHRQDIPIEIVATDFSDSRSGSIIRLSRGKQNRKAVPRKGTDLSRRNAAYRYPIPVQLWQGKHKRPTAGPRSSRFGKLRTYLNKVKSFHMGTDISNDEGTPVYAANHGIVTLSEEQSAMGHVVIVGHGLGLSTSYNHLMLPGVPRGTRVKKGDLLGLMGTTGRSTGPHLHWGMEIHWDYGSRGIAVDPEQWIEEDFDGVGRSDFE